MKIKRYAALFCSLVMAGSMLAGCGNDDSKTDSKKSDTSSAVTSSVTEEDTSGEDVSSKEETSEAKDTSSKEEEKPKVKNQLADFNEAEKFDVYWGDASLRMTIPNVIRRNEEKGLQTALEHLYGEGIQFSPVHAYKTIKSFNDETPEVWFVSSVYTQDGYKEVKDNEGAYTEAVPFIEMAAKYAYGSEYKLDTKNMDSYEADVSIEITSTEEKSFGEDNPLNQKVPVYAQEYPRDDGIDYKGLFKKAEITVKGSEGELKLHFEGCFVNGIDVRRGAMDFDNAPMFEFAFTKVDGLEGLLDEIVTYAYKTIRNA